MLFRGCVVLSSGWRGGAGVKIGRQAAWRPRCNHVDAVKTVDGTVGLLLLSSDCVLLGLCVWGSSSVVKTDWRPSAITIVLLMLVAL